jgi:hypothetical protein
MKSSICPERGKWARFIALATYVWAFGAVLFETRIEN